VTRFVVPVALALAGPAFALEPAEIVVVANAKVPASVRVAEHYAAVRKLPAGSVVRLDLPAGEDITRDDYDRRLAGPLREALKDRKDRVRCVLTVYGVPLRVGGREPTAAERGELADVRKELEAARGKLSGLEKAAKPDPVDLFAARADVRRLGERELLLSQQESQAAVDSELMLLWWPAYTLARWQANPLHWQFPEAKRRTLPPTLLAARLDGPTPEIAMRLVDDAVAVEATGLRGKAYVDARGIAFDPAAPGENGGHGYGGYDQSMRDAAAVLKAGGLDVTLDDKPELFAPNNCPDAALYCGWYALADYRPCGTFTRGAVAWHLASAEAVSLRDPEARYWCPNLLKAGVAATLGPVAEPYTVGFPKPAEFFGFLATGRWTLAEVHARTVPFTSWMTVLVGDPLYTPFKANPAVKEADVFPSPKGGRPLFR
jgi:uncharacterized protein (TIGR03790 family)